MCKYFMTDCAKVRASIWQRIAEHVRPHNGFFKLPHKKDAESIVEWCLEALGLVMLVLFIFCVAVAIKDALA